MSVHLHAYLRPASTCRLQLLACLLSWDYGRVPPHSPEISIHLPSVAFCVFAVFSQGSLGPIRPDLVLGACMVWQTVSVLRVDF